MDRLDARFADVEQHGFALFDAVVPQRNLALGQDAVVIPDGELHLVAGVAIVMEGHHGIQARIRQRALRQLHIGDFDVVLHHLLAEADGVHRDVLAADFGEGVEIDAAGVIGPVAQHHHGADRQAGGIGHHFLQTFSDMRGGGVRGKFLGRLDAVQVTVHLINAHLELVAEVVQQAVVQDLQRSLGTGHIVLGVRHGHAGRVINQDGDNILLGLQSGDAQCRVPQHEQENRGQRGLQQPHGGRAGGAHQRAFAPDEEPEQRGGHRHTGAHHPQRPAVQKNK